MTQAPQGPCVEMGPRGDHREEGYRQSLPTFTLTQTAPGAGASEPATPSTNSGASRDGGGGEER